MVNATMIVNSMDPAVNIPVGDKAQTPESAAGRVVINVYQDGVFANGNGRDKKSAILADESAITSYVHDMDRLNKLDGIKTRILIRADQGASVGQVKKAVQAAGDAGVIDIIFAAYQKAQGGK